MRKTAEGGCVSAVKLLSNFTEERNPVSLGAGTPQFSQRKRNRVSAYPFLPYPKETRFLSVPAPLNFLREKETGFLHTLFSPTRKKPGFSRCQQPQFSQRKRNRVSASVSSICLHPIDKQ